MVDPFKKLVQWLGEEVKLGNIFPQGAVLATQSMGGMPHSRMVRVVIDQPMALKIYTSRVSRKVKDVGFNPLASLTFAFQSTLRSASLEGRLVRLDDQVLDALWPTLDMGFRRNHLACGHTSGLHISSPDELPLRLAALPPGAEEKRPDSFIGFELVDVTRVEFYTVVRGDFDQCELYQRETPAQQWQWHCCVP